MSVTTMLHLLHKYDTGKSLDVLTFAIFSLNDCDVIRSYIDTDQGRVRFTQPYRLHSGVGYALRFIDDLIQLWEIRRPEHSDDVLFIREANHATQEEIDNVRKHAARY